MEFRVALYELAVTWAQWIHWPFSHVAWQQNLVNNSFMLNQDRQGLSSKNVYLVHIALPNDRLYHFWSHFSPFVHTWWRHQMETFSTWLAICAGNSPVNGEFPTQRPVTRTFDVFFHLRLINSWVNNREAGDLRRYRAHYDVTEMWNRMEQQLITANEYATSTGQSHEFQILTKINIMCDL